MNKKDHEALVLQIHKDYGVVVKNKDRRIAELEDEILGLTQSNNELRWKLNNPQPPETLEEIDVGIERYMRDALKIHNDRIADTMGVPERRQGCTMEKHTYKVGKAI